VQAVKVKQCNATKNVQAQHNAVTILNERHNNLGFHF